MRVGRRGEGEAEGQEVTLPLAEALGLREGRKEGVERAEGEPVCDAGGEAE